MTAPECLYLAGASVVPTTKRQTCIEALADGWINPPDLCPVCTAAFMTALDGIDKPLKWHPNYLDRTMS